MSPSETPQGFRLTNPVAIDFFITSRFNDPREYKKSPTKRQQHEGIDLKALDASGRPVAVLAAQRGIVDKVGDFPPGYGNYVRIRHDWPDGNTYVTWYGHMSRITVTEGQFVLAGEPLGIAGDTGFSSGVHLHLTLQHLGHGLKNYVVDDVVDPTPFFRKGPPVAVNECMFVADVTVPDGTLVQPDQRFPKTWRIRNSGTTGWKSGYRLGFFAEERMGGPESVALPALQPGEEANVTVDLTAPSRPGRYRSVWKPRDLAGNFFNFHLFSEVVVAPPAAKDDSDFLSDLSVPDGTVVEPGQTFLKRWRARNIGTTTWDKNYQLAFFTDEQMGAPATVPVPAARPGEEVELAVSLKAPVTPGLQRSTWRLRNAQGEPFGDLFFALVDVRRAVPADTGVDELRYVDDVTFEDGTLVQPGQVIEKIWRVRNSGTTRWGPGYALVFVGDEKMGAPDSVPLPQAMPGQTVDIPLTLVAPAEPGTHRTTWKPRNPDGEIFEFDLFAEIKVVQGADPASGLDDAKFVRDVTVPDNSLVQAGEAFLKTWRMRNTGTTTWAAGYELAFSADEQMGMVASVALPPAAPGQEVDISVRLTAPLTPGSHKCTWRPRNPQGKFFGHEFFTLIQVPVPVRSLDVRDGARLVEHETVPNGTVVQPGEVLNKAWRVRNLGDTRWENGYTLAYLSGDRLAGPSSVPVPVVEPLGTGRVAVTVTAPTTPGRHRSIWKLRNPRGDFFGSRLFISIEVLA